jgi:hypothetical protein
MNVDARKDPEFLHHLDELLNEYIALVEHTELSAASKGMYADFAGCFVRWVNGTFEPGVNGGRDRPKFFKASAK